MRAQQGRSDDTGVTAALIELIERPADTHSEYLAAHHDAIFKAGVRSLRDKPR